MLINLKQAEIIEALKAYVATQGISLAGKKVIITINSGRKSHPGFSADVLIEEQSMPVFTGIGDEAVITTTATITPLIQPAAPDKSPESDTPEAPSPKASSLFS
jgi:hypothetical protein